MRSGSVDGVPIEKAADLVLSQVSKRTGREAYVDHAVLLESNGAAVKRLVPLPASLIADEAGRMGAAGDVVLAGGGSPIPGMVGALEGALGANIIAADDPVMSNAAGFEGRAAAFAASLAKVESQQ